MYFVFVMLLILILIFGMIIHIFSKGVLGLVNSSLLRPCT